MFDPSGTVGTDLAGKNPPGNAPSLPPAEVEVALRRILIALAAEDESAVERERKNVARLLLSEP